MKIEQSFGILVPTWGILWKPLGVGFAGRTDMIVALFHLHNVCRDEQTSVIAVEEEDTGQERGESSWQRVGFCRLRTRVSSNRQARQPPSPLEAATLRRERRRRRFYCTTDSFARRRTLSGTPRLERVVYCVDSELVDILAL